MKRSHKIKHFKKYCIMMSLRGRGGSRGPVCIKLARVIPKQGQLKSEDLDVYEDKMVCASDGPMIAPSAKKRGRPKKNFPENLKTMSVNLPNSRQVNVLHTRQVNLQHSRQVVYIPSPSSTRKTINILPLKNQVTITNSQGVSQQVPIVNPTVHARKAMKQVIPAANSLQTHYISPVTSKPHFASVPQYSLHSGHSLALKLQEELKKAEEIDTYPEDLRELEREYDELVGSKIWEIICWMDPLKGILKYPKVVQKNHELVNELFPIADLETKVDEVVDWLQEHFPTSQDQPQVVPPKVVVETQPNHLQGCNQWSSMAESRIGES